MKNILRLMAAILAISLFLGTAGAYAAPSAPFVITPSVSSGEVCGAVVGGHWVYWDGKDIYSLPLDKNDAKPVLLEAGTIPFHVWGECIMFYARPAEGKPYRRVLIKPDGTGRRVIDKRQSEFISPIGASGDVCYSYEGEVRRYSLSSNKATSLGFEVRNDPIGLAGDTIMSVDWAQDRIFAYTLKGKRTLLFQPGDQFRSVVFIGECALVVAEKTGSFLVWPNGGVRHLTDELLLSSSPWAFDTHYVWLEPAGEAHMDRSGYMLDGCLVGPEGVYPVNIAQLTVEGDGKGNAVVRQVDASSLIPIAKYPLVGVKGK